MAQHMNFREQQTFIQTTAPPYSVVKVEKMTVKLLVKVPGMEKAFIKCHLLQLIFLCYDTWNIVNAQEIIVMITIIIVITAFYLLKGFARHHAKCFGCISLLTPYRNTIRRILLLFL